MAALALMTVGCGDRGGTAEPGGGGASDELRGRTFLATDVTEDGKPRQLAAGSRISLWFSDDGRLVANAGCNTIAGQVRLDGGHIATDGDLSTTEMGCDPPRHAQDEWLAQLLQARPSWRLDGDQLVVTSGTTELVLLDREVAEPDLPLEGTRWTVDTIYSGGTAATAAGADGPYLVFEAGKVTGSTGCNTLEGPATVSGSTIRFGDLIMTRKACPGELAPIEQAIVAVLQGDLPFTIEADKLTLNPNGEHGLGLRGQNG